MSAPVEIVDPPSQRVFDIHALSRELPLVARRRAGTRPVATEWRSADRGKVSNMCPDYKLAMCSESLLRCREVRTELLAAYAGMWRRAREP